MITNLQQAIDKFEDTKGYTQYIDSPVRNLEHVDFCMEQEKKGRKELDSMYSRMSSDDLGAMENYLKEIGAI